MNFISKYLPWKVQSLQEKSFGKLEEVQSVRVFEYNFLFIN